MLNSHYQKMIKMCSLIIALGYLAWIPAKNVAGATTELDKLVVANNKFAIELYGELKSKPGNIFYSPFSISTALSVPYLGAQGDTEKEMRKVLQFEMDSEELKASWAELFEILTDAKEFELNIANALWVQSSFPFKEDFLDMSKKYFSTPVNLVDFKDLEVQEGIRKNINAWVEDKTKDKIVELIKPEILNKLTRLVMVNAIYFKGKWESMFDKERTSERPFNLIGGNKINVPLMEQTADFHYFENEFMQAIEMPYKGDRLSMLILLPKELEGIGELESKLTLDNLNSWISGLSKRNTQVYVPRFKMSSELRLKDNLRKLGMEIPFIEQAADFKGMYSAEKIDENLYISDAIHKAFVDVNEEGTEAAAATAVVMKGFQGLTPIFYADHPFIFLIRDKPTESILFIGRVENPG